MTIITHDDGTGARIHVAYEGPYPWDDGAEKKARSGIDGWAITHGARAEYLQGDLLSDWDTATGTFLGTRPVYEPSEAEKLGAEMSGLLSYLASTDWYGIRLAETGEEPPLEVSDKRQEARNRISEIRELLKEVASGLADDVR